LAATYVPNPAGIKAMLATPAMVDAMDHIGQLIRIRAEAIAPVVTGAYAFGLEGGPGVTGGGFHVDAGIHEGVARVRVINDVHRGTYGYGQALEFGTRHMRKQRILGRALDALNLA
jgi:hypothetical protein